MAGATAKSVVAFVGLGRMGVPMANRIAESNKFSVLGWNRSQVTAALPDVTLIKSFEVFRLLSCLV